MGCGIYKITNVINRKVYIGSSVNIKRRWYCHFSSLRRNCHGNLHLQGAWNKYGEDFFIFEILLYCDKENLLFYEQKIINKYKSLSNKFGYNAKLVLRTSLTGSNYNNMCQKMSDNHTDVSGKKNPMYGKTGKKCPSWGKPLSKETKQKISKKLSGKNHYNWGKPGPGGKPVIANFKHYNTLTAAAKGLFVDLGTIKYRIKIRKPGYQYID